MTGGRGADLATVVSAGAAAGITAAAAPAAKDWADTAGTGDAWPSGMTTCGSAAEALLAAELPSPRFAAVPSPDATVAPLGAAVIGGAMVESLISSCSLRRRRPSADFRRAHLPLQPPQSSDI